MDFRPDLTFEYDYIRIVYEVILSKLRVNKKVIEKEINTILLRINNLKKKTNISDTLTSVKALITKLNDLETKVNNYFIIY
jgi:hypothetical protein